MFDIHTTDDGRIALEGRFDSAHEERARAVLDSVSESAVVDFKDLEYIASAGLGILLRVQKRLVGKGQGLKIINLNPHIREIFEIAGFDRLFQLE